jgi:uncharacterized membrane protein YoaK (UPF0700 family)
MDHKTIVIISWSFLIAAIAALVAMALGFLPHDSSRLIVVALFAISGGSLIALRAWYRQKKPISCNMAGSFKRSCNGWNSISLWT